MLGCAKGIVSESLETVRDNRYRNDDARDGMLLVDLKPSERLALIEHRRLGSGRRRID
jgi:hypothetical protein